MYKKTIRVFSSTYIPTFKLKGPYWWWGFNIDILAQSPDIKLSYL